MRLLCMLALTCLLALPQNGDAQEVGLGREETLGGWLEQQGYAAVPMQRLPTGHFAIAGTAGANAIDMIIDTGASHTVIDIEGAERLALATEDRGGRATGFGMTSQSVESGFLEDVTLGPARFESLRVTVLDLSQVNRVLRRMGNSPVDGVLGADVLMSQQAVIDYGSLTLYFKAE